MSLRLSAFALAANVIFAFSAICGELLDLSFVGVGKYRTCVVADTCTHQYQNCDAIEAQVDNRDCTACPLVALWGGCLARIDDPVCRAARDAQNAIYQAERSNRKLACEMANSGHRAECQQSVAAEKAKCEMKRNTEISAGVTLTREIEQSSGAAKGYHAAVLAGASLRQLQALFPALRLSALKFYAVVDTKESGGWFRAFFWPDFYVPVSSLRVPKFLGASDITAAPAATFVKADTPMTVESVLRAGLYSLSFERLGPDGLAQAQRAGVLDIEARVTEGVIRLCDRLRAEKSKLLCTSKVNLRFE